jgi:type I restriction enzyme S subunit
VRIAKEKTELLAKGKIKKRKPLAEISDQEVSFKLPDGWVWLRLGELALSISSGGTPSKNNPEYWGGDIPWASVKDLNVSRDLLGTQDYITQQGLDAGSKLALAGDIIICTRMGLGKIAVAAADVAINQDLKALKLTRHLDVDYFLNFYKTLKIVGSGMTVAGIKQDDLLNFPVPIPPLVEQHRIVAKVDELMALCDTLESQQINAESAHVQLVQALLDSLIQASDADDFAASWQRMSEHFDTLFTTEASIDALKQTVLQLAVMGKLVPQDPNDESASDLLKRISDHRSMDREKKRKSLADISEVEKPFELPSQWAWATLPGIGELARGKSSHRPRNDPSLYSGGNVPLIQTGDVARASGVVKSHSAMYNAKGVEQSRLWPAGTMCITIAANIADSATLGFDACFPDSVVGFIPEFPELDIRYFEFFLRTAKSHLQDFAPSTAQKNINLEILGLLSVPIPPANEIRRIVAKVDGLMALCDQLTSHIRQARALNLQLASTLVERAVA